VKKFLRRINAVMITEQTMNVLVFANLMVVVVSFALGWITYWIMGSVPDALIYAPVTFCSADGGAMALIKCVKIYKKKKKKKPQTDGMGGT
jgi:hypothetical protein